MVSFDDKITHTHKIFETNIWCGVLYTGTEKKIKENKNSFEYIKPVAYILPTTVKLCAMWFLKIRKTTSNKLSQINGENIQLVTPSTIIVP